MSGAVHILPECSLQAQILQLGKDRNTLTPFCNLPDKIIAQISNLLGVYPRELFCYFDMDM
jgi:hypothetical protein